MSQGDREGRQASSRGGRAVGALGGQGRPPQGTQGLEYFGREEGVLQGLGVRHRTIQKE